jgi:hypothetical protein
MFSTPRPQALNLEDVRSNGYSFQIELTHKLWRQGMKIVEVPIIFTERAQGHSKCPATSSARRSSWFGGCGSKRLPPQTAKKNEKQDDQKKGE